MNQMNTAEKREIKQLRTNNKIYLLSLYILGLILEKYS